MAVNTKESSDPMHIMLITAMMSNLASQLKYETLNTEKRCSLPSV